MEEKIKRKDHYEIYCHMVDKENKLTYQWWYTVLLRWDMCYKDMWKYIPKRNQPLAKGFREYKKLCIEFKGFNYAWFRKYFKEWKTIEEIIEITKQNPWLYKTERKEYNKNYAKKMSIEKTRLILAEIRL